MAVPGRDRMTVGQADQTGGASRSGACHFLMNQRMQNDFALHLILETVKLIISNANPQNILSTIGVDR
jgi:hypothetical protein